MDKTQGLQPKMKEFKLTLLAGITLMLLGFTVVQSYAQQEKLYQSANKLRLTFLSNGAISGDDELAAEWPIGTGHEYLNSASPVVAVAHSGEQWVASFSVVPASVNASVAMSNDKTTWPAQWNGVWQGLFRPGQFSADLESYMVLEDESLGLRLTVRGLQWSHYLAQDIVVWYYELNNIGGTAYDDAACGFFVNPDVGGDEDNDVILPDPDNDRVVVKDPDDSGTGQGVAKGIGDWSPVGWLSVDILETPGVSDDGVDNDGDGLIDESRSDGIDNDGDWDVANDDVGADGVPDTGDTGEGDGIPSAGEPNFDATDVDESDVIGLTSYAALSSGAFNATSASSVWSALTPGRIDSQGGDEFVLGSGGFSLAPGQIQRFSVAVYLSVNEIDRVQNAGIAKQILSSSYEFPIAPPRPQVSAVAQNERVTIYWDSGAEVSADFEGYKIYRSSDPGFNDVFTVTTDRGIIIYSDPVVVFDLDNEVSDLFGLHTSGFRYFLGRNTGLKHWWTDTDVENGKTYYYAVVAYDRGDVNQATFPTESPKSIIVTSSGKIITDINTVVVTPTVESSVFESPELEVAHTQGVATGIVEVEIVDRTLIKEGGHYELTFAQGPNDQLTYSLTDVTTASNPQPIFLNSSNFSGNGIRNDADPIFDGLHTFLFDTELAWDSPKTEWKVGDSNWRISLTVNDNLGTAQPVPVDYEVRFSTTGVDTAISGTPLPVPFEVWNVTDNIKENFVILDQNQDGVWNPGELIFIATGSTVQDFRPIKWTISLNEPGNPNVTSVPPESGDVAFIPTLKPFTQGDFYVLTTKAVSAVNNPSSNVLNQVAVVPNPYIVNSSFEQLSMFTGGSLQRRLQFIHLPAQCKIQIFTLRGHLIDTIEHESTLDDGSTFWDLQTTENETIAYGVYIFHIEAPGIGEKIGRFAIIR